jgi:phosphatidate cytidylyltransferase
MSGVFWLVLAPLWLWRGWRMSSNDMAGYITGWLLIVPTWAAMLAIQDRNPWWLFAVMALVWVADISAYFAGRAWGRHKLAPTISPGKTWEGVMGAVAGVAVYSIAAALVAGMSPVAEIRWAPMLVALTVVSVIGDLFESMIKRQAGVKDSSQLLPGHGGFLDRLDSQTSILPLAALILLGMPT